MKNPDFETLGGRIRYALENHPTGKKTQDWLRERLGVSQGVISQWCNNMQKPKNLHAVARELVVNVVWLETGEGEPYAEIPAVHERIPNYKNLRDALIKSIFSGNDDEARERYATLLDAYIEEFHSASGNEPSAEQTLGYLRGIRDAVSVSDAKGKK